MNRLYRSNTDKVVGGVCGGLGEYLNLDPLIVRIIFAILAILNGIGLALYILMWILVPAARTEYADQEQVVRQNIDEIRERARELGQEAQGAFGGRLSTSKSGNWILVAGAVLVGVGLLTLFRNFGLLVWLGKLWPLVLIALGVVVLMNNLKDR